MYMDDAPVQVSVAASAWGLNPKSANVAKATAAARVAIFHEIR